MLSNFRITVQASMLQGMYSVLSSFVFSPTFLAAFATSMRRSCASLMLPKKTAMFSAESV